MRQSGLAFVRPVENNVENQRMKSVVARCERFFDLGLETLRYVKTLPTLAKRQAEPCRHAEMGTTDRFCSECGMEPNPNPNPNPDPNCESCGKAYPSRYSHFCTKCGVQRK